AAVSVEIGVRDGARQRVTATYDLVVRPASAAGDTIEWTRDRLAEVKHAYVVTRHEAGVDVAAVRARTARLRVRVARRPRERNQLAAVVLAAAAVRAAGSWLFGALAILVVATALAYAIGPALLAPARRDELERLEALLGCGRPDCPRCLSRQPWRAPEG